MPRTAELRLRCARAGHLHAARHQARGRWRAARFRRETGAPARTHARPHHGDEFHLHPLRRREGVSLRDRRVDAASPTSAEDAALAKELRLVSMSFDPANDTPERMAAYSTVASQRADRCTVALRHHALANRAAADPRGLRPGGGQEEKPARSDRTAQSHPARLPDRRRGQHPKHLQLRHARPAPRPR